MIYKYTRRYFKTSLFTKNTGTKSRLMSSWSKTGFSRLGRFAATMHLISRLTSLAHCRRVDKERGDEFSWYVFKLIRSSFISIQLVITARRTDSYRKRAENILVKNSQVCFRYNISSWFYLIVISKLHEKWDNNRLQNISSFRRTSQLEHSL